MGTAGSGNAGEAAVLAAFIERGHDVLLPFGEGHPYDLVAIVDGAFLRVQAKTAWRSGGCLLFNAYSTDHGRGQGSYLGRADVFGVYLPESRQIYIVPVDDGATEGRLRLDLPRNNQRRRIRFAREYELGCWSPGALAALAAARLPSVEVRQPLSGDPLGA